MVDGGFNIKPISSLTNISRIDPTHKDLHDKNDQKPDSKHNEEQSEEQVEKEPENIIEDDDTGIDILA